MNKSRNSESPCRTCKHFLDFHSFECFNCEEYTKWTWEETCGEANAETYEVKENNDMENNNIGMVSPWIMFVNKLEVLFVDDPDVLFEYDQNKKEIILKVKDLKKAYALDNLLKPEYHFGNITLTVKIIPANNEPIKKWQYIQDALANNTHFSRVINVDPTGHGAFHYIMMKPHIAQFYSDDISDPNGNTTMLYSDLVKDIFGDIDGVFYCTEALDDYEEE